VVLRARDALVTVRTQLINTTRGLVKSMGARLPKCFSPSFPNKVEEALPAEVSEALLPLVRLAEELSDCVKAYDERIEKLGREKYEHTELLRQVKGVGPLTSLAYVLTLQNPDRFAIGMERNVEEERAHSKPAGCPAFALRERAAGTLLPRWAPPGAAS
jgi:transposase